MEKRKHFKFSFVFETDYLFSFSFNNLIVYDKIFVVQASGKSVYLVVLDKSVLFVFTIDWFYITLR